MAIKKLADAGRKAVIKGAKESIDNVVNVADDVAKRNIKRGGVLNKPYGSVEDFPGLKKMAMQEDYNKIFSLENMSKYEKQKVNIKNASVPIDDLSMSISGGSTGIVGPAEKKKRNIIKSSGQMRSPDLAESVSSSTTGVVNASQPRNLHKGNLMTESQMEKQTAEEVKAAYDKAKAGTKYDSAEHLRNQPDTSIGDQVTDQTSFAAKMKQYQIPQKAAAVGATAWLVSNMSSRKGQQSNGELYGQQTPYR